MLPLLMRSGSPDLSLRPLGAAVVALALMGCLEAPRLPTADNDAAASGASDAETNDSSVAPRDIGGRRPDAARPASDDGLPDGGLPDVGRLSDGGESADSLVLPERNPAPQSRLIQGGVVAVSPAWMLRGRLVSGGATQASPQWRVTAKIVF